MFFHSILVTMTGTIFFLLALSILSPEAVCSLHSMSKEWQEYLEYLINRKIQEHVWFDHLDETPAERSLWTETDQAPPVVMENQEQSAMRQLEHVRRPSLMDYRIRIR